MVTPGRSTLRGAIVEVTRASATTIVITTIDCTGVPCAASKACAVRKSAARLLMMSPSRPGTMRAHTMSPVATSRSAVGAAQTLTSGQPGRARASATKPLTTTNLRTRPREASAPAAVTSASETGSSQM